MSTQPLQGRTLLLGVSGSIAAYKAASLVRLCKQDGADIQVLLTADATRFITPLTLGTLSGREPLIEIFSDHNAGDWAQHVSLGQWADLFVIAPATAHTLAKLASGFCDNMLTATALAARCPVLVCPAMDRDMWLHAAVRANMEQLTSFGYHILPPTYGELASGLVGHGRMPEPEDILARITQMLTTKRLSGKHALVTAGPTREPIDPVRIITNHSTGTMGYALAAALRDNGARVTLVSGPTALETPKGVHRIDVTTADEMHQEVENHRSADIVFMAAAVADYTPTAPSPSKLKKKNAAYTLQLQPTRDILAQLGEQKLPGQLLVGFAMETDAGLERARQKLVGKNLDFIALNNINEDGAGFGTGTNRITLLGRNGSVEEIPAMPKRAVADTLLDHIFGAC